MSKLTSTQQLDWVTVQSAANHIVILCEKSIYIAPECVAEHRAQINAVCA